MARRKAKKPQQDDTSILLDSSVPQSKRKINSLATPALLFIIIFTVGASIMGWFCVQQQHSLDELSESFTTMQRRITNLQQVMQVTDAQVDNSFGVEERIFALEEAQKQAQENAQLAMATSEKLKSSNLYSQILALHDEMDTRLAEMKQVSVSVTTLQAMFKNQSEEFEAVKKSVVAGLSSSSALAENVAGLTNAVASAYARADEQVASVEALNALLEDQASELNELKDSMHLHNVALYANNQQMAAIKKLLEAKQAKRAQALEEMLNSVQTTLDEQFSTSQTLHSSVMAQLQTFHTQLTNAPSWTTKVKSNEESPAEEELISSPTQSATEVEEELEDDEKTNKKQDAEDEGEEEEEEEEEAMQEEQPLEEEVEGDITEEQEEEENIEEEETTEEQEEEITEEGEEMTEEEEEDEMTEEEEEITEDEEITEEEDEITEEEEDEEITEHTEEQEVAHGTAEEEEEEETLDDDFFDESLEEEDYEENEESWEDEEEEESAELNGDKFMDENEEDD